MAIVPATDFKWYLSGGSGNTDPNSALGGARSTTQITNNTLNNLFSNVTGTQNTNSTRKRRCIYVRNEHATLTAMNLVAFIFSENSAGAAFHFGLDPAGVNGTATTIANEEATPAGVTFSNPTTEGAGTVIPNLAPNAFIPIWIELRPANTSAVADDDAELRIGLDTAP